MDPALLFLSLGKLLQGYRCQQQGRIGGRHAGLEKRLVFMQFQFSNQLRSVT